MVQNIPHGEYVINPRQQGAPSVVRPDATVSGPSLVALLTGIRDVRLDELKVTIDDLELRLTPVLRPEPPRAESNPPQMNGHGPSEPACEALCIGEGINAQFTECMARLSAIVARLQL